MNETQKKILQRRRKLFRDFGVPCTKDVKNGVNTMVECLIDQIQEVSLICKHPAHLLATVEQNLHLFEDTPNVYETLENMVADYNSVLLSA